MESLRRFLGRENHAPEVPSRRILGRPDSAFIPTYRVKDYLDEKELDREIDRSALALKQEQDKLRGLVIPGGSAQEVKEFRRWQESHKKVWDVTCFSADLDEEFSTQVEQAESGEKPITQHQFTTYHILQSGGTILIDRLLEEQLRYARRNGFEQRLLPYAEVQRFIFGSGAAHAIRIAGTSIREIMEETSTQSLPPSTIFRFLMESMLVRLRRSHEQILQQNQGYLMNEYPNRTRHAIEGVGAETQAVVNVNPETIDDLIARNRGIAREIAQNAKRFYERIRGTRQAFFQTLINPNSPDFSMVSDTLERYLRQGKFEKIAALNLVGLSQTKQVSVLYRKTQELRQGNLHPAFYELLNKSILEYIDEVPITEHVLTADDAATLIPDENGKVEDQDFPSLQLLGKTVSTIFSKSSVKQYTPNPQDISWGKLVEPQDVEIQFDQNRPHKFTIDLSYENEAGEQLNLYLDFDTTKNTFDWNFVEAPADPRMKDMYKATLLATQSVLSSIRRQAEETYEQRKQQKTPDIQQVITPSATPKERITDEAYEIRKQMRAERRAKKPETTDSPFVKPLPQPEREQIKNNILLSDTKSFDDMLKNIGFSDRQVVRDGINEFNEKVIGEFTRKRRRGREGDILYTLRINCSVPKGIRVLMRESQASEGMRSFEILDIRYRKDTYRKAGI